MTQAQIVCRSLFVAVCLFFFNIAVSPWWLFGVCHCPTYMARP